METSRHNLVGSGLSEPLRSCVWGVAVSGEIESFSRPGCALFSRFSYTVVMYDWAVPSDSAWKLQGALEHPEELCWGQYLSVGPQATSQARGYRHNVFNHPIDALAYSDREEAVLDPLPKLVVQVVRIDSSGKQALEGYGFVEMPSRGAHLVELELWAPPTSFSDDLVGVYKPLVSRLNVIDLIADKSEMTVRRSVGTLTVKLQVITVRGRGKPLEGAEAPKAGEVGPNFTPARARRVRTRSENDPSTN